ncbi:DUF433 domain-containing protein, partial [Nostoc sp. ChiQUE01b]|uniref:DUF433 domain-containing protein n=1 Tax=Nostoc sp. ChiQUE01b TaxID=3075376 RepID=UPI002AD4CAB4
LGVVATDLGVVATDLGVVTTDLGVIATDLGVVATDLGEVASVFLMQSRFATIKTMNLKALMTLAIIAEPAPLRSNKDGVVLVGNTRITLDTIAAVFKQGATAEEIVYRYPSLNLADVYATIAFYLNHQAEVEAYLQQRQ